MRWFSLDEVVSPSHAFEKGKGWRWPLGLHPETRVLFSRPSKGEVVSLDEGCLSALRLQKGSGAEVATLSLRRRGDLSSLEEDEVLKRHLVSGEITSTIFRPTERKNTCWNDDASVTRGILSKNPHIDIRDRGKASYLRGNKKDPRSTRSKNEQLEEEEKDAALASTSLRKALIAKATSKRGRVSSSRLK